MQNKQIVFTAPCTAELLEKPLPSPGPGEVLVKVMVSTISSGTERANITGDPNTNYQAEGKVLFPRTAGYSTAGIVIETGENVESLKKGDRVAMYWSVHATYNCLPEKQVAKIPDAISFSEAALVHIGCFPLAAIRKCRLEIGEAALVMGQGILGQMAVMQLRAAGAAPVIAADPKPEKRARALELGADYAFDPYDPAFVEKVKEASSGGAAVCIEVTGFGAGLDGALDCMKRFGRVALLGCTRNSDFTIDYYRKVHGPGIVLYGAHTLARPGHESSPGMWTTRDDMQAQLKLISLGRLKLSQLVEETHTPEEAPAVYTRLCNEKSFPVVQFDWSDME